MCCCRICSVEEFLCLSDFRCLRIRCFSSRKHYNAVIKLVKDCITSLVREWLQRYVNCRQRVRHWDVLCLQCSRELLRHRKYFAGQMHAKNTEKLSRIAARPDAMLACSRSVLRSDLSSSRATCKTSKFFRTVSIADVLTVHRVGHDGLSVDCLCTGLTLAVADWLTLAVDAVSVE